MGMSTAEPRHLKMSLLIDLLERMYIMELFLRI